MDFQGLRELSLYLKPRIAELRASARARSAELKAELASLKETRAKRGEAAAEEKPKKKKKRNRE